jgi:transcriptional regulator with XRE-family HTH domain
MDINVRLTRWREHKGMTKSALAAAAETTPQAVDRIETGDSNPSVQMLERLVEALDISMAEFYGSVPSAKDKAS